MIIYTVGHSNISIDDFIKLLRDREIEVLVDVRSSPYSQYAFQFNKENLINALTEKGIKYLFLGDLLGGRPNDPSCFTDGKPDYDKIRQKDFYKRGIERLLKGVSQYCISIMCSEEDPMKCHRRNLIAKDLHERGIMILHIRGSGVIEKDDFSIEEESSLQGSLFK